MNFLKNNLTFILLFVIGVLLICGGANFYSFAKSYTEKSSRNVTLVDTSSTTTKHKQKTYYNTNGFFVEDLTGQKFKVTIQDKLYREFEAGGNKPIKTQKILSQEEIDNGPRGLFSFLLAGMMFIVGGVFIICVLTNKFLEYTANLLHFIKYGNQNE